MWRSNIVAAANFVVDLVRWPAVLRRSLHARLLAVAFLGVLLGGTAAWWGFPQVATASNCNASYNTVATNNTLNYSDYGEQVNGPGMNVFGGGASCARISSIESNAQNDDEAEVGWLIQAPGVSNCIGGTGDNTPHVFYTWVAYGTYACHENTSYTLVAGNKYPFSIRYDFSSPSGTQKWIYDFNGNVLDEHDNGFKLSQPTTNGERHSTDDGSAAHFIGMNFRTASDTWSAWGHSACSPYPQSDDPDFNNQLLSNTEIQVSQQAAQC